MFQFLAVTTSSGTDLKSHAPALLLTYSTSATTNPELLYQIENMHQHQTVK
jgi:hypothetical protein